MTRFVAATVRALGAAHGAVGMLVVPQTSMRSLPLSLFYGALVFFVLAKGLEELPNYRAMAARGYLLPVCLAFGAFAYFARVHTDAAFAHTLSVFVSELVSKTPYWVYAAAVAYGAFQAQAADDEAEARAGQPNYYR